MSAAAPEPPNEPTAGERYPSLKPAFQQMIFAYNEFEASLGSLNTRAGVALGLAAGGLIAALACAPKAAGWTLNAGSLLEIEAVLWFLAAVFLLAWSLLSRETRAGYSTDELHSDEWRKSLTDFYLQQLSNLKEAIPARQRLLDRKADLFNAGVVSAVIGLVLLVVSRALNLLALGRP